MWHVWGRREFWWVNLKERSHLKDVGIKAIIMLKGVLKNRMRGPGLDWSA
jgi:hypothetical protein